MANRIRFGVYELDASAMELRRHGTVLRLQVQPLRVLAFLAARPGELVTRDELREWIWGDTFVDFEHSLNKAINRAREALHDDPANPQYIETVPRRGYRFIAPVTVAPLIEAPAATISLQPAPPPGEEPSTTPQPGAKQPRRRMILLAAFVIVLLAAAALILVWQRSIRARSQEAPHLIGYGWQPALSPDGKLVAYPHNQGGFLFHIWLKQTAGGQAVPVTSGPDTDVSPSFSPDGTQIVFGSRRNGGGIFLTPTLPGEARVLVANPSAYGPMFSPNGDSVLFVQNAQAFLVSPTGGDPRPFPMNPEFRVEAPAYWSPDGKEILVYGEYRHAGVKSPVWWIAPLQGGAARPASLPGLEKSIEQEEAVRAWVRSADDHEWIIYSISDGDSWRLWRIQVSPQGSPVDGKPQLLAEGNGSLSPRGSGSKDGLLTYAVTKYTSSILQIPVDDHGRESGPVEDAQGNESNRVSSPSLSRDGRWMAYDTAMPGKPDRFLLRDLEHGTEHLLDETGPRRGAFNATSISPDGSRIAFTRDCKEGVSVYSTSMPCGFMVSAEDGKPEQICEACTPRGFSSDGSLVLLEQHHLYGHDSIGSLNISTRIERLFLSDFGSTLDYPFFSWDDRWVVFQRRQSGNTLLSQLFIAPVRNGSAAGAKEWIAVTDGHQQDDKPQFSADGNTVFYTSARDGYLCVWAQRLDARTKHPVGPALAFEHFHNPDGAVGTAYQAQLDLSVARNKMVLNFTHDDEPSIWLIKMR